MLEAVLVGVPILLVVAVVLNALTLRILKPEFPVRRWFSEISPERHVSRIDATVSIVYGHAVRFVRSISRN